MKWCFWVGRERRRSALPKWPDGWKLSPTRFSAPSAKGFPGYIKEGKAKVEVKAEVEVKVEVKAEEERPRARLRAKIRACSVFLISLELESSGSWPNPGGS